MSRRTGILILSMLLAGCGKKPEPPAPEPAPPPEPELVALPDLKIHGLEEIDTEKLHDLPVASPSEFRWDFSGDRRWGYIIKLDQMIISSASHIGKEVRDARIKGRGTIDFHLKRVHWITRITECIADGIPQSVNDSKTAKLDASVGDDGTITEVNQESASDEARAMELLFVLPRKALQPGESEERLVEKEEGGIRQTGKIRTTLTGYRKVERYECARLMTEADYVFSRPAPGAVTGLMRGRVIAYFCPAERKFIRIEAALSMSFRTNALIGKPGIWSQGALDSDVISRVNLAH